MNKNIDRSSILQMARGAFQERVDYEMGRVVDNILDLNTKATAKRKITLTIELTPDDERQTISVAVQAKATLAPTNPVATALCKQFGERRQLAGHEFYTFPTWDRLAGQDLSGLGLGYRDKYVEQLAQNVADGRIDLHELTGMETEQARTYLKSIHGVGNKVADCVLLFGLHRVEAFPVDTWIRQVIDEHYGGKFPVEHYDGHAGIIQQFIFYYMQQHKGGKTT